MTDRGSRILAFDCFSGIAGDMALAALLDAGASFDAVRSGLANLGLPAFELRAEHVARSAIPALHLSVLASREVTYQADDMRRMVEAADLPGRVKQRATAAVNALEAGEAMAHGGASDFHEVGGVDALIDIVGTMLALESLGIEACYCPVVTVGSGTIARSAHGVIPAAPGPAAAHILRRAGFPLRFVEAGHELVTPTGAAILAAVARPTGITMVTEGQGSGAGTFDPPGRPNALRVFLGRPAAATVEEAPAIPGTRALTLLEANIDDLAPTLLSHARDRLMDEGALDAWTEPIGMKKGRPAVKLCALVPAGEEARFAGVFLAETTTLGVRATGYRRFELEREVATFQSSFGPVRVKYTTRAGRREGSPEYEDVREIAGSTGRPAMEIQRQLLAEVEAAEGRGTKT